MKIAVVVPTYNEAKNIETLIQKIAALNLTDWRIFFVDDNSPDKTSQIIQTFIKQYPITLIQRPQKLGLGSAYVAGFKEALKQKADYIFEMDADLSHNPQDIPSLLQACEDGADLAIGSRKINGGKIIGWNWRRHFMSDGAMFFSRFILGLKTRDVTSGFRCYSRKVLESINFDKISSGGYAFQEEMLYLTEKNNFKITEVPVIFSDRKLGKSKLSTKDIWEFFITVFRLKFKK
ncbi:MAG TPA: polyprenol monophosphomannose synthase [Candidatus Magasanikbacteria bacterium]|nr:polyprenol monophosphomannose synthase [Candidatus Magasanikbacteria bacterium]